MGRTFRQVDFIDIYNIDIYNQKITLSCVLITLIGFSLLNSVTVFFFSFNLTYVLLDYFQAVRVFFVISFITDFFPRYHFVEFANCTICFFLFCFVCLFVFSYREQSRLDIKIKLAVNKLGYKQKKKNVFT